MSDDPATIETQQENAEHDGDVEIRWAVLDRAMQWWMAHRPIKFTHEQHLENPTINCSTRIEKELAEAVANYMKH